MGKRKITKLNNLKFVPFDKYGKTIKGWTWHNISFEKKPNEDWNAYSDLTPEKVMKKFDEVFLSKI